LGLLRGVLSRGRGALSRRRDGSDDLSEFSLNGLGVQRRAERGFQESGRQIGLVDQPKGAGFQRDVIDLWVRQSGNQYRDCFAFAPAKLLQEADTGFNTQIIVDEGKVELLLRLGEPRFLQRPSAREMEAEGVGLEQRAAQEIVVGEAVLEC
jgi:hypothetical protein